MGTLPAVNGYCPNCGHEELGVTAEGFLYCQAAVCGRRTAAAEILDDARETEHLVRILANEFNVKHPLWERLDDNLLDCAVHAEVQGTQPAPGRYRLTRPALGYDWAWERLP